MHSITRLHLVGCFCWWNIGAWCFGKGRRYLSSPTSNRLFVLYSASNPVRRGKVSQGLRRRGVTLTSHLHVKKKVQKAPNYSRAAVYLHATYFFPPVALRPNTGHGLLILEVSRSHTTMYQNRCDSSGGMISSSQRPLPDNTQHSQQTNIHSPGGIRTHDLSRRAAADLRLRPRGHWDTYTRYRAIL